MAVDCRTERRTSATCAATVDTHYYISFGGIVLFPVESPPAKHLLRTRTAVLAHNDRITPGLIEIGWFNHISVELSTVIGAHGEKFFLLKLACGFYCKSLVVGEYTQLLAVSTTQRSNWRCFNIAVCKRHRRASGREHSGRISVGLAQRHSTFGASPVHRTLKRRRSSSLIVDIPKSICAIEIRSVDICGRHSLNLCSGIGIFIISRIPVGIGSDEKRFNCL